MAGTPIAVSPPALPWTTSDGTVISKEITTATQANGVFTLNMTSYAGVMWSIQVDGRKTYIIPDPGPGGSIDVKALTPIYQNSSGAVQGGAGVSISGATIENGDTLVFFLSNGYRLPGIKMPSGNAVIYSPGRTRTSQLGVASISVASIPGMVWKVKIEGEEVARVPDPGAGQTVELVDWMLPAGPISVNASLALMKKINEIKRQARQPGGIHSLSLGL